MHGGNAKSLWNALKVHFKSAAAVFYKTVSAFWHHFFAAVLGHCWELHHLRIQFSHSSKQWRESSVTRRYHQISWHEKAPLQQLGSQLVLLWHVISTGSRHSLFLPSSEKYESERMGKKKHPSAKRNIAGQVRGGHKAHIRMRRNTAALKLVWARVFRLWLCEPA